MLILHRHLHFLLFIMILIVSGRVIAGQRENAIKSGFLYNFARFSQGQWFDGKLSPTYQICSFDSRFVKVAGHTLKGRTIKNKPVIVRLLASYSDNIADCHTLFITKNERKIWPELSAARELSKLMLVGEFDGFIGAGGHINFFVVGGKVRFEVNPDRLKESGINMSSKVLRLGRTNKGSKPR